MAERIEIESQSLHHASDASSFAAMLGTTYDGQVCSISRTLEVFGERWTFLVMRNALFADSTRFMDFQRSLGVATNVLTARLAHLVERGVFEQPDAAGRYILTARGRDLTTALIALTEWGDRWDAPDGEPVLYTHRAGAHSVHARVVCDVCGVLDLDELEPLDGIETLPGPGMPEHLAERLLERHEARHH